MFVSVPSTSGTSTRAGKRPRADSLLGHESAHTAVAYNCIKARVANREQKCLVDTGATVSLASRHLINGPLKPCTLKARGIGGEELQVIGMANVPVNVGSLTLTHPFVVVGMCNICILGADFLKSGQMVVDMANARLLWPRGGVRNFHTNRE